MSTINPDSVNADSITSNSITSSSVTTSSVIESFKKLYQALTIENIESIKSLYATKATFEDPFHKVSGIEQLVEYFSTMYQNIEHIDFEFEQASLSSESFHINWTMNLVHPKLNKGQLVSLKGCSFVQFNEQGMIEYHRDYFDAGAMLYEQLPIIKYVIKKIKQQF